MKIITWRKGGWSHLPLASDEIPWGFALAPGEGRALLRQCKKEHCGFIRRFVALHRGPPQGATFLTCPAAMKAARFPGDRTLCLHHIFPNGPNGVFL